ncbi:type IV pilus modification protein PilV [Halomonas sp. SL1]|uniref:type IV pilus modification protein PilV n=1 Tax=Halomonas sp. SL1 TaxID=2137478 RepID=UPI0021ACB669|nr:type IV pilus modification protein PilV [Halomonas sp. SL1]
MPVATSIQRGFSLLEALIALLVLSIGLLGVAGMQLKALQGAHAAYQRSIASLAAQDAQERLWAEMAEEKELSCPSESVVNGHEAGWHDQWSTFLPGLSNTPVNGHGECEFDIDIAWAEERFSSEGPPAFEYRVRLPGRVVP